MLYILQLPFISENIFTNSQNVTSLHKELLEINLSVTAFIEESKKRLDGLRLNLAHEAKSSQKVVEILSEKSKFGIFLYLFTVYMSEIRFMYCEITFQNK